MPRERSAEKRDAFLRAAVSEIAKEGTQTSTARIARRAALAESTLFTYFPNKAVLFNELYLELKSKVYRALNRNFPIEADLYTRTQHIWNGTLIWGLKYPSERKASLQLHLSNAITAATRAQTDAQSADIRNTMVELAALSAFEELPANISATVMGSMQDALLIEIGKDRDSQRVLMAKGFEAFWRICR